MYDWLITILNLPSEPSDIVVVGSIICVLVALQYFLNFFFGSFFNAFRKY